MWYRLKRLNRSKQRWQSTPVKFLIRKWAPRSGSLQDTYGFNDLEPRAHHVPPTMSLVVTPSRTWDVGGGGSYVRMRKVARSHAGLSWVVDVSYPHDTVD
ncbi:hypothetical protein FNV43_RR14003 [Rhamnella rubrinervis]|uniref:Uncharacterized protein n=1 Tax=Rhamnella rubrinervis TaxID=2594499 RepID=A0A8K0H2G6_9ROSA|nr:hypothetical protein FNV43_RR14003 [Rhamnella rubrinervis]